jgi:hypothetical protein
MFFPPMNTLGTVPRPVHCASADWSWDPSPSKHWKTLFFICCKSIWKLTISSKHKYQLEQRINQERYSNLTYLIQLNDFVSCSYLCQQLLHPIAIATVGFAAWRKIKLKTWI